MCWVWLDLVYSLPTAEWLDSKAAVVLAKQNRWARQRGKDWRGKGECSKSELQRVSHESWAMLATVSMRLLCRHGLGCVPPLGFCGACLTRQAMCFWRGWHWPWSLGCSLHPSCQKSLSRQKWIFNSKTVWSQESSHNRGHKWKLSHKAICFGITNRIMSPQKRH